MLLWLVRGQVRGVSVTGRGPGDTTTGGFFSTCCSSRGAPGQRDWDHPEKVVGNEVREGILWIKHQLLLQELATPQKHHFCGLGLGLEPDRAGRAWRALQGRPEGVLLPIPGISAAGKGSFPRSFPNSLSPHLQQGQLIVNRIKLSAFCTRPVPQPVLRNHEGFSFFWHFFVCGQFLPVPTWSGDGGTQRRGLLHPCPLLLT